MNLTKLSDAQLYELLEEKKSSAKVHYNLQYTYKILMNSLYGAFGNAGFRHFDIRIASAITATGRSMIGFIGLYVISKLAKFVPKVTYTDTDSFYISLKSVVERYYRGNVPNDKQEIASMLDRFCEGKIQPFIDEAIGIFEKKYNLVEGHIRLKREAIAEKGLWMKKKKYALSLLRDEEKVFIKPKFKIMGIDMIKPSYPIVVRDAMNKAVEHIMVGTEDSFFKHNIQMKKELMALSYLDFSFIVPVNKLDLSISNFELDPKFRWPTGQVKAAYLYNKKLTELKLLNKYPLIQDGERVYKFPLRGKTGFGYHYVVYPIGSVIPKEFKLKKYLNFSEQYDKLYKKLIHNLSEIIGWQYGKRRKLSRRFEK